MRILVMAFPWACVVVTEDTIIQAGSGYDHTSCGVLYMRVRGSPRSTWADREKRALWIDEVEKRVATGVGSGRPSAHASLLVAEGG